LETTCKVTLPFPEPEELPETVIQPGRFETVQTHDEPVWMPTVKLPPAEGGERLVGVTEYEQEGPLRVRARTRLLRESAT
jgi:hypothetical protein